MDSFSQHTSYKTKTHPWNVLFCRHR